MSTKLSTRMYLMYSLVRQSGTVESKHCLISGTWASTAKVKTYSPSVSISFTIHWGLDNVVFEYAPQWIAFKSLGSFAWSTYTTSLIYSSSGFTFLGMLWPSIVEVSTTGCRLYTCMGKTTEMSTLTLLFIKVISWLMYISVNGSTRGHTL